MSIPIGIPYIELEDRIKRKITPEEQEKCGIRYITEFKGIEDEDNKTDDSSKLL